MSDLYTVTATFLIGNAETEAVKLNSKKVNGLIISSSVVTGSLISFLGSADGTTFIPVLNSSSTEVTITTTASPRAYALNDADFMPFKQIKARLGTSGSAKLQATYNSPVQFIIRT